MEFYNPTEVALSKTRRELADYRKRWLKQGFVIDKAKDLLIELRKDIELTMRNNQAGKNLLVVGICKEKLRKIDEILNWKGDEQ